MPDMSTGAAMSKYVHKFGGEPNPQEDNKLNLQETQTSEPAVTRVDHRTSPVKKPTSVIGN